MGFNQRFYHLSNTDLVEKEEKQMNFEVETEDTGNCYDVNAFIKFVEAEYNRKLEDKKRKTKVMLYALSKAFGVEDITNYEITIKLRKKKG